jgi:hypothetical protein
MQDEPGNDGQRHFGWGDLLRAVNLRDFSQMVRTELSTVASTLGYAGQALTRLPLGPVLAVAGLLLLFVRMVLLVFVVVVFGAGILIISAVRAISGRGRKEGDA